MPGSRGGKKFKSLQADYTVKRNHQSKTPGKKKGDKSSRERHFGEGIAHADTHGEERTRAARVRIFSARWMPEVAPKVGKRKGSPGKPGGASSPIYRGIENGVSLSK